MAAKIAVFKSVLVVNFDDDDSTPHEALEAFNADNNITEFFELLRVEDEHNGS